MSKTKLSAADIEALKNVTESYTSEELNVVIKAIPDDYLWNELMRRDAVVLESINHIEGILDISLDCLRPIPAKAWAEIRTRYEDLQNKFLKIRKGFNK